MNKHNILGHFKAGEEFILLSGTGDQYVSAPYRFLQDANLYDTMDQLRPGDWKTLVDQDYLLYLIDEGIAQPFQRETTVDSVVLSSFRFDPTIPSRADVDKYCEEFPLLADLAAEYAKEDQKSDVIRMSANTAFNEIIKALRDDTTFKYIGDVDMPVDGYLRTFFTTYHGDPAAMIRQGANFFNYLVKNVLLQRAEDLIAKESNPREYENHSVLSRDGSRLNFTHTVGLSSLAGLEFIIAIEGGDLALMDEMLNVVADAYLQKPFGLESIRTDFGNLANGEALRVGFREVPLEPALDHYITEVTGEVTRVVQILIADLANKLPGEEGFDKAFNQEL